MKDVRAIDSRGLTSGSYLYYVLLLNLSDEWAYA